MSRTVLLGKKGTLKIPRSIRDQYQLDEDDPITLVDLGEGIFLSPKRSLLPTLVNEIEILREKNQISMEELIQIVTRERDE